MFDRPRLLLLGVLATLYAGVPLLFGSNLYLMSNIVAALTIGGIALAWALLGNLGGMVSFGHAAFVGVGAYVSALCVMKLGLPVFAALPLAGVGAALASILIAPALRLRGPYFALSILAYAHIFKIIATEWKGLTNGSGGLSNIPRFPAVGGFDFGSKTGSYLIVLTLVLLFAWIYHRVRRSHYGLALRAMHDSEEATRVIGVNSLMLKALMLLLSAFMAGVMGAFNAHYINFLEPDYAFSSLWTTLPIVAAIFGGYRTISGPIIGAVVVYLVDQLIFKSLIASGHQVILGVLLIGMILWSPGGLLPPVAALFRRQKHAEP
ncbi:MAG: branched-chain amino acid ABC transporter permease [Betaproteobacteria bacterium]